MGPGNQRKRMLKLARRVPVEQIEEFVLRRLGSHPCYFVLCVHGYELLRGWHCLHGAEVFVDDDVLYTACCEYLKERGLVFESTEAAVQYARERGLLEST